MVESNCFMMLRGKNVKKIFPVLAVIILFAGAGILLYHPIQGMYQDQQLKAEAVSFEEQYSSGDGDPDLREHEELYQAMFVYNQEIYENGQADLKDAWSYEDEVFDLQAYGFGSDEAGAIEIPAMDLALPLYLGATEENMEKGAAILGQTSMPIGGDSTNCVIAAHRGYASAAMFRRIEDLQVGDTVYLHNFWGTLEYTVTDLGVILPDQTEVVRIREGHDLLTLITCHPYGQNSHRYVVRCERSKSAETGNYPGGQIADSGSLDRIGDGNVQVEAEDIAEVQMALENWLPLLAFPLIAVALLLLHRRRNGEHL